MKVFIDTRETDRIKPAMFYFSTKNSVSVEELDIGDYIFEEDDKQVVFEYKTMSDFINSVTEGRVFNQAIDQQSQFLYHFVIIEGTDEDLQKICSDRYYSTGVSFSKAQFYGAIARLNTFTTVIRVPNRKTVFDVMEVQSKKCLDDKAVAKSFPKSEGNAAFRYLCYCCNRIGSSTAEKIVDELSLNNLEDIIALKKDKLTNIYGIGDATADTILEQVRKDCS